MYDEEDIRREAWFKTEEEEGRTIHYINKPDIRDQLMRLQFFFRTAEMYLINAEAKCRQNRVAEAKDMLETFKRARIIGFENYSERMC